MKFIYFFLLIVVGLFTKAQQSDLINNTWYLQKMIGSNGTEIPVPNNWEANNIKANFGVTSMTTTVVNQFGAWVFPGTPTAITNTTMLYDEFAFSTNSCQIPENCAFENTYFFFGMNLINYQITNENNGTLKLILTDNYGRQAIYNTQYLAVNDLEKNQFKIYPNPVKEYFTIDTNDQIEQVEIYSTSGKLLKTVKSKKINISDLAKGNYLVKIKTDKEIITQKIIKE